jgi:hypothetical protein
MSKEGDVMVMLETLSERHPAQILAILNEKYCGFTQSPGEY